MSSPIYDEFTSRKDLSRQEKYQLRSLRDGRCKQCRHKVTHNSQLCIKCHDKQNKRVRTAAERRKNPTPQDLI